MILPILAQFGAAAPSDVSTVLEQFHAQIGNWRTAAFDVAIGLFAILVVIEFAVLGMRLFAEKADAADIFAAVARQFIISGLFYYLILQGPTLMQAVVDGYVRYAQLASGVNSLAVSDLAADGLDIMESLMVGVVVAGGTLSFLTAGLLLVCTIVIGFAYWYLVKTYVMAIVQTYLAVNAAFIQAGWGGSRFTSNYAERYIEGAMHAGIRLMVLYLIVGVGRAMAPGWIATAQTAMIGTTGLMTTLTLTFSICVFSALANLDKVAAAIWSGSPQFGAHDLRGAYAPAVGATVLAMGVMSGASGNPIVAGGMSMASRVMGSIGGSNSPGSANRPPSGSAPPPANPGSRPHTPPPPANKP
jgi:type IV secretion system protein TrbL